MMKLAVIILLTLSIHLVGQNSPEQGDRFAFTTISAIPVNDTSYGGGYSIYSSVWPLFDFYPETELFQTGLVSAWMTPQPTGNEPTNFYNTIEGGLGWWTGLRFGHVAPKFIMGGVSNNFFSWANGPGAGQAEIEGGFRDWSEPNGMLEIAQLSNTLLWPPDGLNMSIRNHGEFLGYGYVPLPLTEVMTSTTTTSITTGNQSWTLFLNAQNFKGPVAFFLPTFWTKPVLEDPTLEGLFLDTRPSEPLSSYGIETATLPTVHSLDNNDNIYFKALPTRYPITSGNESVLLNRPMIYSKAAMWDNVVTWFNGGVIAPTTFAQAGQLEILFDSLDSSGSAWFSSQLKIDPGGDLTSDEFDIETPYVSPFVKDQHSWGYQMDLGIVESDNLFFKTPTYFEVDTVLLEGNPILEAQVPIETRLLPHQFMTNSQVPQPYLTPLETDCPWHDPNGVWLNPGPASGPFQVILEDGSTVTYYWYKFIDQPSIIAANLSNTHRQLLQQRIEMIHTQWTDTDPYLPDPTTGNLARLDGGLKVNPPTGLEIGYVPIATRQETSNISSISVTEQKNLISLYPNPANSTVYFSEFVQSFNLYGVVGNQILWGESTNKFDIQNLNNGVYFVTVHLQNDSFTTLKLIKK